MNMSTKKVIFIVGPTAIGKTALSMKLAQHFKTEIISCDSRQFYKELLIGSAPPSPKELEEVQHHFIHNLSISQSYNAGKYEIDAINKITEIHKTNDCVIVVGGSGFYADAISKGLDKMPKIAEKTREKLNSDLKERGLEWLQDKVKNIDPEFYNSCDIKNPQRLLRCLEVFTETGKKLTSFKTKKNKKRPFDIIKIGLNMDREKLYSKINKRVDFMMECGLLEEVLSLIDFQGLNSLQTVGYKEIFSFINNECTLQEAVEKIKQNTRRFAKRQLTWFKKDKEVNWFEPDEYDKLKSFIGL
jgi:tRNA dimethylallyltransferase